MTSNQNDELISPQIIMLGNSNAGKTAIVTKYVNNDFDISTIESTLPIDYKMCNIKRRGMKQKFKIWDTAGQERFRTLTQSFFKKADGAIVVFDVTDKASFDQVAIWMEALTSKGTYGC